MQMIEFLSIDEHSPNLDLYVYQQVPVAPSHPRPPSLSSSSSSSSRQSHESRPVLLLVLSRRAQKTS